MPFESDAQWNYAAARRAHQALWAGNSIQLVLIEIALKECSGAAFFSLENLRPRKQKATYVEKQITNQFSLGGKQLLGTANLKRIGNQAAEADIPRRTPAKV